MFEVHGSGGETRVAVDASLDGLPAVDNGDRGADWPTHVAPQEPPDPRLVKIVFWTGSGFAACSGTVIGANLVLTAGHCVHSGRGGRFYSRVQVAPAYRDGKAEYGIFQASRLYAFSGWTDASDNAHDIGVIQVDHEFPMPVRLYRGVRAIDPHCIAQGSIHIAYQRLHYSSTFERMERQAQLISPAEYVGCNRGMITTLQQTNPGSSGSAAIDPSGQYIFAVHSAANPTLSFAALITPAKACIIFRLRNAQDPRQACDIPKVQSVQRSGP